MPLIPKSKKKVPLPTFKRVPAQKREPLDLAGIVDDLQNITADLLSAKTRLDVVLRTIDEHIRNDDIPF